jgi:methionyl aminopeptidase
MYLKAPHEMETMRRAGRLVAMVLRELKKMAAPGIVPEQLDEVAERTILAHGGKPAFKGYSGYPATICASVNDAVVHGIPGRRPLEEGDVLSLDVGAVIDGYYADAAITVTVGSVSSAARKLVRVTRQALEAGIRRAKPGAHVADIAGAVERFVARYGFSVVRELSGHGIGRKMHEPPQVPNFVDGASREDLRTELKPGMTLCIEPMVNQGSSEVVRDPDGWTMRTRDHSLSAHFEHTVAIGPDGPEILTRV